MVKNRKIKVEGTEISLYTQAETDYISITDIAKGFESGVSSIESWFRNRNTVEFLGVWEQLNNPNFNSVGFDGIKEKVGLNTFKLSAKKWIAETNAIGIQAKAGRYGGTYAHKDIAIQFGYWLSPKFQLYLIREFQRLKEEEAETKNLQWNVHRIMAKANYKILTEAVREHLIPPKIQYTKSEGFYFASEADLLNLALFGMSAKEWEQANPTLKGNIRDHATHEQLLVLSNLQSLNAKLMKWGCDQKQRLQILNESAIEEMQILVGNKTLDTLTDHSQNLLDEGS